MNYNIDLDEAPYTSSRKEFAELSDNDIEDYFNLSPLQETIYNSIRLKAEQPWEQQEMAFLDADANARAEWLFASRMLAMYGQSRPQIKFLLETTPPDLQLSELTSKRKELIMRLAGTVSGKQWFKCIKLKDGCKYIARFIYGAQSRLSQEDTDNFLLTLDQIGIIHDMIKGRGRKYRLGFEVVNTENVEAIKKYCKNPDKAQLIVTRLHRYIDKTKGAQGSSKVVRAMMDAGALKTRIPWEVYVKEFGNKNNNKSSYNEYTNPEQPSQFTDELYKEMVKEFKEFA